MEYPVDGSLRTESPETLRSWAADDHRKLRQYLQSHLPPWPVTKELVRASEELSHLKTSLPIVQVVGLPASLTERIEEQIRVASAALGHAASRVDAVSAQGISSDRVNRALAVQAEALSELARVIHTARESLAVLTVAGVMPDTSLEESEVGFNHIREAAQVVIQHAPGMRSHGDAVGRTESEGQSDGEDKAQ